MDINELLRHRKITRAIAQLFRKELDSHLRSLTPLLSPRLVFGTNLEGGKQTGIGSADKALDELRVQYEKIHSSKPFNMRKQFDVPIPLLSATPELSPMRYRYVAKGADDEKAVSITSPLRWVLSFERFGPSRLQESLDNASGNGPALQQVVLHCLLLSITVEKKPDLTKLFEALRFPLTIERCDEFGALPLVVVSGPMTTCRPPDDIIIESTEISGTTDFEEIVDPDQIENLSDPLRDKIRQIVS